MSINNPLLNAIRAGGAPKMVKIAAAKGSLPLPPDTLLEAQVVLVRDSDPDVSQVARDALQAYADTDLLTILESKQLSEDLLQYCASFYQNRPPVLEKIIINPVTPNRAFTQIAYHVPQSLAELIISNQVRLIECPEILDALRLNPHLTPGNRQRLKEIENDFLTGRMAPAPVAPAAPVAAETESGTGTLAGLEMDFSSPVMAEPLTEHEFYAAPTAPSPAEEEFIAEIAGEDQEQLTIYQKISRLPISEKIKLALIGRKEERALLIRDSNKLVAISVLSSPKLTDSEVELFSQLRNVSEEILRTIGTTREWIRSYRVALNLIKNPKTPAAISLSMINRLTNMDLKLVDKDRMVPESIRQQARRLLSRRQV